jgi:MEMO1 family protein
MSDKNGTITTRSPALAGVWYPSDPVELAQKVDGFLAASKPKRIHMPVQVLMTPHAGYDYCGAIMAEAFRHIQGYAYRRVIVIGPSHEQGFNGLSLPGVDQFQTPLGEIGLDKEVLDSLRQNPIFQNGSSYHEREHSIEILLPFLQQALGEGWKLVPILTGGLGKQDFIDATEAIRPWLGADDLLVISGDFTHYGPLHNYVPFPADDQLALRLQQLDQGVIDHIVSWDPEGLAGYAMRTKINACILAPAIIMLNLLNGQSVPFHFNYRNSATDDKSKENSVSYCSGLFMGPIPIAQGDGSRQLSSRDLPILKKLAEKCLKKVVVERAKEVSVSKLVDLSLFPLSLRQKRGAFVTITKNKKARSSFGTVPPLMPLYLVVVENTIKAANDKESRFAPITSEEFPMLELSITTLSLLSPAESPQEIELGRHGIAVEKGQLHAAFLPNIAVDQGWNIDETLNNLSAMAGLPVDSWQQPDCQLMVFTTQNYP